MNFSSIIPFCLVKPNHGTITYITQLRLYGNSTDKWQPVTDDQVTCQTFNWQSPACSETPVMSTQKC